MAEEKSKPASPGDTTNRTADLQQTDSLPKSLATTGAQHHQKLVPALGKERWDNVKWLNQNKLHLSKSKEIL